MLCHIKGEAVGACDGTFALLMQELYSTVQVTLLRFQQQVAVLRYAYSTRCQKFDVSIFQLGIVSLQPVTF